MNGLHTYVNSIGLEVLAARCSNDLPADSDWDARLSTLVVN